MANLSRYLDTNSNINFYSLYSLDWHGLNKYLTHQHHKQWFCGYDFYYS